MSKIKEISITLSPIEIKAVNKALSKMLRQHWSSEAEFYASNRVFNTTHRLMNAVEDSEKDMQDVSK